MLRHAMSWGFVFLVGSWSQSALAEVRAATHVACVGDSITEGGGVPTEQFYPSQLQGLMGSAVQVRNFGKSGATALSTGFGDLPYDQQTQFTAALDFVSNAGPEAVVSVIIMLGANDSKPMNWSPQGDEAGKPRNGPQYLKDYRTLVDRFLGLATKPVVYVALPLSVGNEPCCAIRGDVISDEIIPLLQGLASERHLPVIDQHTPTAGHPELFLDGVHPTAAGYTVVATTMKAGLEQDFDYSAIVPPGGSGTGGGGTGGAANGGSAGAAAGGKAGGPAAGGASGGSPGTAGALATAGTSGSGGSGVNVAPASSSDGGCAVGSTAPRSGLGGGALLVGLAWALRARPRARRR